MDGFNNWHGWQWMFLLEGLLMIPLGIITYLFLSNVPTTVQCKVSSNTKRDFPSISCEYSGLNNIEKQLLTNILRDDAGAANRENVRFSWRQTCYVLIDVRVWLYALIAITNLGVIKYLNTYLPLILDGKDFLEVDSHLSAIPPYILALVCCLSVSYSASRRHEFGFHIIICLCFTTISFILMAVLINSSTFAAYICKCIGCAGSFAVYPLIFSWLTNNVSGHTKRSVAVGLVIGLGQIGGIAMPFVRLWRRLLSSILILFLILAV
jgi:Major Facilitator Superfamily